MLPRGKKCILLQQKQQKNKDQVKWNGTGLKQIVKP